MTDSGPSMSSRSRPCKAISPAICTATPRMMPVAASRSRPARPACRMNAGSQQSQTIHEANANAGEAFSPGSA